MGPRKVAVAELGWPSGKHPHGSRARAAQDPEVKLLDMAVREFLDWINWAEKSHLKCGWHHPLGWGPTPHKEEKMSWPQACIITFCFSGCGPNVKCFLMPLLSSRLYHELTLKLWDTMNACFKKLYWLIFSSVYSLCLWSAQLHKSSAGFIFHFSRPTPWLTLSIKPPSTPQVHMVLQPWNSIIFHVIQRTIALCSFLLSSILHLQIHIVDILYKKLLTEYQCEKKHRRTSLDN